MTTYRKIHGRAIQAVTTDPSESVAEGQVWYNTTSDTFKSVVSTTAWASGAALSTAKHGVAGSGTQTAALSAGGNTESPPSAVSATSEEYNGSGWAAGGTMGTARNGSGSCGTQTAALVYGGLTGPPSVYKTETELYNGTSWSEQPDISTARYNFGNGVGTSTAALYFCGWNGANLNNTEEYDGSSWTNGGVYPTIARDLGGAGTQTAGLGMGGYMPSPASATPGLSCTYDGSSWTAGPSMNTGRSQLATGGTQTAGIGAGGYRTPTTAVTGVTETFDGTSFTETADLGTARRVYGAISGTTSAFLAFAGSPKSALTEEFTSSANVITAAAWAAGGNVVEGRANVACLGIQTASMMMGGHTPSSSPTGSESYDGTSWSEGNNLAVAQDYAAGAGTQAAGLCFGGAPNLTETVEYDGTNWSESGNLSVGRAVLAGCGTQTAGLGFGGYTPIRNNTEEYDGSSWTTGGTLGTARYALMGFGTQTAGLAAGGDDGPAKVANVEEYNGTAWSEVNNFLGGGGTYGAGCGTQTAGLVFGGSFPSYTTATYGYDGTNWSTRPSMSIAGGRSQGSGTNTAALMASGGPPAPRRAASEEFTGETTALNVKTLTQS